MSIQEFRRWEAYYSLEPFGQERDNYHMATLASLYANTHSKTRFTTDDFMIIDSEQRKQKETSKVISELFSIAKKDNKNG